MAGKTTERGARSTGSDSRRPGVAASRWRLPRVHVMIPPISGPSRDVIAGILSYVERHGPWELLSRYQVDTNPAAVALYAEVDGVIAEPAGRDTLRALRALHKPVVIAMDPPLDPHFPSVIVDRKAVAAMAVEYFLDHGFEQFAFYGVPGESLADLTQRHLADILKRKRRDLHVCHPTPRGPRVTWLAHLGPAIEWVRALPKPVALLAANDVRGWELASVCRLAGVLVPETAAILAIGNDDYRCRLAYPPVSAVDCNYRRIGYEAAAMLDRLMRGARPRRRPVRVSPAGIIDRASTDILAVSDGDLAAALHFIRDHACTGATARDVADHVPVARRTLEQKFRQRLGRTIREQITRIRVEQASRLLRQTEMKDADIARACGFRYESHFSVFYKRATGLSPRAYRRRARGT